MNYALPKSSQLAATDRPLERSLLTKLEALKERLDNLTVIDTHGKPVGDVRNLVISQRQLCLVIVQPDVHRYWRFVLLGSHLVQRVNLRDRVVFVQTTQADMSYLPAYLATSLPANSSTDSSAQTTFTAPINQLPARLATDRTHRFEPAKKTTTSDWLAAQSIPQVFDSTKPQLPDASAMPKVLESVVGTPNLRSSNRRSTHPNRKTNLA